MNGTCPCMRGRRFAQPHLAEDLKIPGMDTQCHCGDGNGSAGRRGCCRREGMVKTGKVGAVEEKERGRQDAKGV